MQQATILIKVFNKKYKTLYKKNEHICINQRNKFLIFLDMSLSIDKACTYFAASENFTYIKLMSI